MHISNSVRYHAIINKLQAAVQDDDIRKKMILEDGILEALEKLQSKK